MEAVSVFTFQEVVAVFGTFLLGLLLGDVYLQLVYEGVLNVHFSVHLEWALGGLQFSRRVSGVTTLHDALVLEITLVPLVVAKHLVGHLRTTPLVESFLLPMKLQVQILSIPSEIIDPFEDELVLLFFGRFLLVASVRVEYSLRDLFHLLAPFIEWIFLTVP
mmetsp:Transcript_5367/g.4941  ORF Transcript_5367/g.4941 Transcript_5367/m.4941 type:complete len:162 (+) Transcript_5367:365-850(+)